jgi:DNA-binding response OmpR family regulator
MRGTSRRVVAAILIVGDEPAPLEVLADTLIGWQISASDVRGAVRFIQSTLPDLLIFCGSIPDEKAAKLIEVARELNQNVQALAVCRQGARRHLNAQLFEVRPEELRIMVARLLQTTASR